MQTLFLVSSQSKVNKSIGEKGDEQNVLAVWLTHQFANFLQYLKWNWVELIEYIHCTAAFMQLGLSRTQWLAMTMRALIW